MRRIYIYSLVAQNGLQLFDLIVRGEDFEILPVLLLGDVVRLDGGRAIFGRELFHRRISATHLCLFAALLPVADQLSRPISYYLASTLHYCDAPLQTLQSN